MKDEDASTGYRAQPEDLPTSERRAALRDHLIAFVKWPTSQKHMHLTHEHGDPADDVSDDSLNAIHNEGHP